MTNTSATLRTDFLAHLLEAHHEFAALRRQLEVLDGRLDAARRYLAAPGSNPQLGQACLDRIEAEHGAALARLRAARREAHLLLGVGQPENDRRIA